MCGMADLPFTSAVPGDASGVPARTSLAHGEFGLPSLQKSRWMQRGIACWALAICITALTYLNFLLVVLGSAPFWNALHQPGSLPHLVYRLSGRVYSESCFATVPLQAAAVILIVGPSPGAFPRRRWLARVVAGAALAAAAGIVYTNVSVLIQLPVLGPLQENRLISVTSYLMYEIVVLVAWLGLTRGLQHGRRTIRVIMWAGFAALAVQFVATVAGFYLTLFGTQATYLDNGLFVLNERAPWELMVLKCGSFCRDDLWLPTEILLCLGLWACLRLLRRTRRAFDKPASGTLPVL
jgi:hypothetical protein